MLSLAKDVHPDLAALINPIERAIRDDRVTSLAETLAAMAPSGIFDRPEFYAPARPDRYSRRLVWKDADDRFVVVGLIWSAGQMSPLHDHCGLWGAEIVTHGIM